VGWFPYEEVSDEVSVTGFAPRAMAAQAGAGVTKIATNAGR
jgi:hypothetical protein